MTERSLTLGDEVEEKLDTVTEIKRGGGGGVWSRGCVCGGLCVYSVGVRSRGVLVRGGKGVC